jgi:hypothetical protein
MKSEPTTSAEGRASTVGSTRSNRGEAETELLVVKRYVPMCQRFPCSNGKQCNRAAQEGSGLCWQHAEGYGRNVARERRDEDYSED